MQESFNLSQTCAAAFLDAYCRNDEPQMNRIATEVHTMRAFYAANPAESERLELLGGIAVELHRSTTLANADNVDPYVRLLLHLANPDWFGNNLTHLN